MRLAVPATTHSPGDQTCMCIVSCPRSDVF